MDSLDRFRPDQWADDGIVTTRPQPARRFGRRPKEGWIAHTAKATITAFALITAIGATPVFLPQSDLVQKTVVEDPGPIKVRSDRQQVEPGHWTRLMSYLDQFPRDESAKTDFDPDPFT